MSRPFYQSEWEQERQRRLRSMFVQQPVEMSRPFYQSEWEQERQRRLRSMFVQQPELSPIYEESRAEVSRRADSGSPEAPLPELEVEYVSNRSRHDLPDEYYDQLERKIVAFIRKLDARPGRLSYSDIHDSYDLNNLIEVPSETNRTMNKAFVGEGSRATFESDREDSAAPTSQSRQDTAEESSLNTKSDGSASNEIADAETRDDLMKDHRGTEVQRETSDESNNQASEGGDDASTGTSPTVASFILPTPRPARTDKFKDKQATGQAEAELPSGVTEPNKEDEEGNTSALQTDSEGSADVQQDCGEEESRTESNKEPSTNHSAVDMQEDDAMEVSGEESGVQPMSLDDEEKEIIEELEEEGEEIEEESNCESCPGVAENADDDSERDGSEVARVDENQLEEQRDASVEEEAHKNSEHNESLQPEEAETMRAHHTSLARGSLQQEEEKALEEDVGSHGEPAEFAAAPAQMEEADVSQEHFWPSEPLRERDTSTPAERSERLSLSLRNDAMPDVSSPTRRDATPPGFTVRKDAMPDVSSPTRRDATPPGFTVRKDAMPDVGSPTRIEATIPGFTVKNANPDVGSPTRSNATTPGCTVRNDAMPVVSSAIIIEATIPGCTIRNANPDVGFPTRSNAKTPGCTVRNDAMPVVSSAIIIAATIPNCTVRNANPDVRSPTRSNATTPGCTIRNDAMPNVGAQIRIEATIPGCTIRNANPDVGSPTRSNATTPGCTVRNDAMPDVVSPTRSDAITPGCIVRNVMPDVDLPIRIDAAIPGSTVRSEVTPLLIERTTLDPNILVSGSGRRCTRSGPRKRSQSLPASGDGYRVKKRHVGVQTEEEAGGRVLNTSVGVQTDAPEAGRVRFWRTGGDGASGR